MRTLASKQRGRVTNAARRSFMPAGKNNHIAGKGAISVGRIAPVLRLDFSKPLSQQVYELIRNAVGELRLVPDHVLSEKEVAEELGVSRTPVREAFIRLSEDGIVRIVPKSGTYVSPIDNTRVNEGYFVWRGLESSCAAKIAENSAFGNISVLRDLVTRQRNCLETGNENSFQTANRAFHDAIFTLADCPGAAEMVENARFEIRRLLGLCNMVEFSMSESVITELWEIVNLMAEKEPEKTRTSMESHLVRIKAAIDSAAKTRIDVANNKTSGKKANGRKQKQV